MSYISTSKASLLALSLLLSYPALSEGQSWPVKGEVDLSSGFCDFRANHFHGGLDIRTGGEEGREVLSPIKGYVWRIRYSYFGYGKALYLRDSSGFIYVFGHLSRLSPKLETLVKSQQYTRKRYYLDAEFPPDSLRIAPGELLAYSGQTGAGPPHLHFEKRTPANEPLNPLTNGYPVVDRIAPEIAAVGFVYVDSCSLFPNGERRLMRGARYSREERKYVLDSLICMQGPFGVEIKAFDRIRPKGPTLNIYRARLYIDDTLYYELELNRYNYDETRTVDLTYDFVPAVENIDDRYLLYRISGNGYSGGHSTLAAGGIYPDGLYGVPGVHRGRIEIFDAAENKSELNFSFVMLPQGKLFEAEWINDSTLNLYGRQENQDLDVKEVAVYGLAPKIGWRRIDGSAIIPRGPRGYQVSIPSGRNRPSALRIKVLGRSGWEREDQFLATGKKATYKYTFNYELTDGGILYSIHSSEPFPPAPHIGVVYDDGYTPRILSTALAAGRFAAFYRNKNISSRIVRLDLYGEGDIISTERTVHIIPTGLSGQGQDYWAGNDFRIKLDTDSYYSPGYVEVNRRGGWIPDAKRVASNIYSIQPEIIALQNPVLLSFKIDTLRQREKAGLCRLNKDRDWQWLETSFSEGLLSARADLFGTFALLVDSEAPVIRKVSPGDGKTIGINRPQITCSIEDDLSGISDDRDITVTLDGRWLIPEYDPERGLLKTGPEGTLSNGKHLLEITARDTVGNARTVRSTFYVKTQ